MKKKVLFVIDSLGCGGAEKSLVSLLPLLDRQKFDISLLVFKRGGVFEHLVPKDICFVSYPSVTVKERAKWCIAQKMFSVALRLNRHKHGAESRWSSMAWAYPPVEQNFDVAVAYQQGLPTYFVAEKVRAEKKYAWVNTDPVKAGYRISFNRKYYNRYTNVIGVSTTVAKQLAEHNYVDESRIVTVFDILNVDLIRKMAVEGCDKLFVKRGITLVTVGRMVPQKNYILAVDTADVLVKRGLQFRWFFVGDGSERNSVESAIKEKNLENRIVLLGMRTNPYPYMFGADIYVQTSSLEGFGLTLTEARLLHKPVVSTNFPVVYDQIRHEVNGMIAEMTPESLAENILRLVEDNKLREMVVAETKREVNRTAQTESRKVNELLAK